MSNFLKLFAMAVVPLFLFLSVLLLVCGCTIKPSPPYPEPVLRVKSVGKTSATIEWNNVNGAWYYEATCYYIWERIWISDGDTMKTNVLEIVATLEKTTDTIFFIEGLYPDKEYHVSVGVSGDRMPNSGSITFRTKNE